MQFQDHPSQLTSLSCVNSNWLSTFLVASCQWCGSFNVRFKVKNDQMSISLRKCSIGQVKINTKLPVTTLGIFVMKLFTVLMGTPSVSCWMLVTMSSICRRKTAEGSEKMQKEKTNLSNRKDCYVSFNVHNRACWTFWYFWGVHHSTLQLSSCFKVDVRQWESVRRRRQLMLTHKTAHKLNLDSGRLVNKDTCSCIWFFCEVAEDSPSCLGWSQSTRWAYQQLIPFKSF